MMPTNFPKTISHYAIRSYRLVQRCNTSYKDFIFAPIDQVNPLRALFRPLKPTWHYKSEYGGTKNTRITVLSIGYKVRCQKYRCLRISSGGIFTPDALLVLDRGRVTPPLADRKRCSGAVPMQTPCERIGNMPVSPFTIRTGLLIKRSPGGPAISMISATSIGQTGSKRVKLGRKTRRWRAETKDLNIRGSSTEHHARNAAFPTPK